MAEERRRQRELEEARKAGLAAPEVRHSACCCLELSCWDLRSAEGRGEQRWGAHGGDTGRHGKVMPVSAPSGCLADRLVAAWGGAA